MAKNASVLCKSRCVSTKKNPPFRKQTECQFTVRLCTSRLNNQRTFNIMLYDSQNHCEFFFFYSFDSSVETIIFDWSFSKTRYSRENEFLNSIFVFTSCRRPLFCHCVYNNTFNYIYNIITLFTSYVTLGTRHSPIPAATEMTMADSVATYHVIRRSVCIMGDGVDFGELDWLISGFPRRNFVTGIIRDGVQIVFRFNFSDSRVRRAC